MADGTVALVLSGGGARGPYEAGALSVLLPALEARGERPRIVVGTSVGAFNAAFVAAHAHRPLDEALDLALDVWGNLRWRDVLAPLVSLRGVTMWLRYLGRLMWRGQPRIESLLDPSALPATLDRVVPFDQLRRNVEEGALDAAAVTATSAYSGRTVVFHAGGPEVEADRIRRIDYAATPLTGDHVRASGAIPGLFPAVHVSSPERARGWYFDGGTRLNTPIKPALELGADRVVVIGVSSVAPGPDELGGGEQPDIFEGAALAMDAMLGDRLEQDVRELAEENLPGQDGRRIPYIFVSPRERLGVGELASTIWRERYSGVRGFRRDPDISTLGRFTAAGNGPMHGELLSFFFFAPEFARSLIQMGQEDARHWLAQEHHEGPWRVGAPPE